PTNPSISSKMVSGVTCPFFLSRNALRLRIFCAILCLCLLKLPPGYRLHPEVQVTDPCRQSHELARGLLHLVCGHLAGLQVPALHLATVFPRLNKLHLARQLHPNTSSTLHRKAFSNHFLSRLSHRLDELFLVHHLCHSPQIKDRPASMRNAVAALC